MFAGKRHFALGFMLCLAACSQLAPTTAKDIELIPIDVIEGGKRGWWSPTGEQIAIEHADGIRIYDVASQTEGEVIFDGWVGGSRSSVVWLPTPNTLAFAAKRSCMRDRSEPCPPEYDVFLSREGHLTALIQGAATGHYLSACVDSDRTFLCLSGRDGIAFGCFELDAQGTTSGLIDQPRCSLTQASLLRRASADGFDVRTSLVHQLSPTSGALLTVLAEGWGWQHYLLYTPDLQSHVDLSERYEIPANVLLRSMDARAEVFAGLQEIEYSHGVSRVDLCILDTRSGTLSVLETKDADINEPILSPDGTRLLFQGARRGITLAELSFTGGKPAGRD